LMQHGRTRIAFLGDASSHYPEFQDRYRGSCEAQGGEGILADPALQVDALNAQDAGYEAAQQLISRGKPFDAIFAASDTIAIGAMTALREHGLKVPDDVAIVGFDDIPAAGMTHPPLTTIQQDYKKAGEVLVDSLLQQIRNEKATAAVLPAKLVVRQSCGAH
jgi:DNA-binding LacI/PurR family transcriptional regulator